MLSPAFFASHVITGRELPQLINKPAGIVPILLEPLDFASMHLGMLDGLQVFCYQGKAFSEMRGRGKQGDFTMALFKRIVETYKIRLPAAGAAP